MACACKQREALEKAIENDSKLYKHKGIVKMFEGFSLDILTKIMVIILTIVLVPVVMVVLLYNYLVNNTTVLKIPKFISKYIKEYRNGK